MSLRQRVPFKFSEDSRENAILNDEEQESLIQQLKDQSKAQNAQYYTLLLITIGFSVLLHIIYLADSYKTSPLVVIFPLKNTSPRPQTIPAAGLFAYLHISTHCILAAHLLSPSHSFRVFLRNITPPSAAHIVPLPYSYLAALSLFAPLISLLSGRIWQDVVWWSMTGSLIVFVYSAQKWMEQERTEIQQLEAMRYDAKGA